MANVNKLIYPLMALSLLAYAAFLMWESLTYSAGQRRVQLLNQHLERLQEIKNVDGLIIGGSNSYYGLSANMISENLGGTWYNASLMNGGFSNQNMLKFIDSVRKAVVPEAVKAVVYSSVYVYQKGDIYKRSRALTEVDGRLPLSLKPQRSVASHVKEWLRDEKPDPNYPSLPDPAGDYVFTDSSCPSQPIQAEYNKEDPVIVAEFLMENLGALHAAFPNAKLFFVFPSLYAGQTLRLQRDENYKREVAREVKRQMQANKTARPFAYDLIFQPSFPAADFVCDYLHHASLKGRTWRTQNLLQQLLPSRSLSAD